MDLSEACRVRIVFERLQYGQTTFVVLHRRWAVERTFSWFNRCRRTVRVLRLPAPPRTPATIGRPPKHGVEFRLADPTTWPAPAHATSTTTHRYGTANASAWDHVHPKLTRVVRFAGTARVAHYVGIGSHPLAVIAQTEVDNYDQHAAEAEQKCPFRRLRTGRRACFQLKV